MQDQKKKKERKEKASLFKNIVTRDGSGLKGTASYLNTAAFI